MVAHFLVCGIQTIEEKDMRPVLIIEAEAFLNERYLFNDDDDDDGLLLLSYLRLQRCFLQGGEPLCAGSIASRRSQVLRVSHGAWCVPFSVIFP